jgi:DNA-directed RNA polymerase specialized sigma24 family protein
MSAEGAEPERRLAADEGSDGFTSFAAGVSRPLRQALVAALGVQRGEEAHAAAMAYAWEHRARVMGLASPVGYLYAVGRSRTRHRRRALPVQYLAPDPGTVDYEPALVDAMVSLPEKQRVAVFLVVGCGWSNAEVARLTGRSESTVRTLVARGLSRLRARLGVEVEP